ncbi:MAG: YfiR family protein [Gammaproteobacteria bacterium]|nr:YfiR family protein [Gammaproteobacteria bacterium]
MLYPTNIHAENILAKEYFLKAAFLYNFARLVEWPTNTSKQDSDPVRLCFIGQDPFDNALHTIQNKKVSGRPLIIQRFIDLKDAPKCHILFISRSEESQLATILNFTQQYPILTISEIPNFAEENGHIRFFLSNNEKLNLEVNLESVKNSGLIISSRILTLAKIVSSKEAIEP